LELAQATKLMAALNAVSSANIKIADFSMFGVHYSLYIKKDEVSDEFLLKIQEVSKNYGLSIAYSDSHYIIS
jgi:hypothetical protein